MTDRRTRRPRTRGGAGPLPPVADRLPARRQRPHRVVQLGVRAALRRHARAAHRGHRPGPQHRGGLRSPSSTRCAGSASTGTRAPRSAAPTAPTCSPSASTSTPTSPSGCATPARPTTASAPTTRSRRAARRAAPRSRGTTATAASSPTEQRSAFEAEGRKSVLRLRMPDEPITFNDLVRGEVTFQPENVPDFVLVRANGDPLYTLVNPVDDALMGITHVLRGEDLLSVDAAPDRALRRAAGDRRRHRRAPLRPPADRDGRGQQAAVQARRRLRACSSTSSAASCPRACSTTWPCSAGASPTTATCSRWRRWPRRSTSAGQPEPRALRPEEVRGDQRLAHADALRSTT